MARNVGNFVLFQVLWFAAVGGAAAGFSLLALPVLLAMLGWSLATGGPLKSDGLLMLFGLVMGFLFEVLFLASGVLVYEAQMNGWAPPVWILLLWAGFAMTFNHSMAWLRGRALLAVVMGASGSVLSLFAGVKLGAAEVQAPALTVALIYGASWAVLVPALASLAEWLSVEPAKPSDSFS